MMWWIHEIQLAELQIGIISDQVSMIHTVMNTIYAVMRDKKTPGLNRNPNQDPCDASAMLYQLNYQANWQLVIMRVHDNPLDTCINIRVK